MNGARRSPSPASRPKAKRKLRWRIWPRKAGAASWFGRFSHASARATGQPWAFVVGLGTILVWLVTGPLFGFSDTWQLVINTTTTIITFLMVFLIQSTQNRDSEAVQLKLDELIRASQSAHNALLDLEELSESDLDKIKAHYLHLARKAREDVRAGRSDLGSPEVSPEARLRARARRQGHWVPKDEEIDTVPEQAADLPMKG